MKYLTPVYLTLMHAFKDRAFECLDQEYKTCYSDKARVMEYGTLRIDGGRQSGKTAAVAQFAAEWLAEGKSVIVIANRSEYARETVRRTERKWNALENVDKDKGLIIYDTIRSFLGGAGDKYRGLSFKSTLIIIEEPMKSPDMTKFYDAWDELRLNYTSAHRPLPLFFVMGMQ